VKQTNSCEVSLETIDRSIAQERAASPSPYALRSPLTVPVVERAVQPPIADEDEDDDAGPYEDDVGIDPRDSRGVESELERLISRLADDMSELAMLKLLPRAKELYEQLHPETRHGGHREVQVAKPATWPSFVGYVAARTGISKRSVYNRLEHAERLVTLDPVAEESCFGSAIANQVGLLVRVAQVPKATLQQDLVSVYRNAGPKKAKEELRRWEEEFGLAQPGRNREPELDPAPTEEEQDAAVDGDAAPAGRQAYLPSPIESPLAALTMMLEVANELETGQGAPSGEQLLRITAALAHIHSAKNATYSLLERLVSVLKIVNAMDAESDAAEGAAVVSSSSEGVP
jgi:hypothetical protein